MNEIDFGPMVESIAATSTVRTRYDDPEVQKILKIWVLQVVDNIMRNSEQPVVLLGDFCVGCGAADNPAVGRCFIDARRVTGDVCEDNMSEFAEKFASLLLSRWKQESPNYADESAKLIDSFRKFPGSSTFSIEDNYVEKEGHKYVDLGRIPKDETETLTSVNAYIAWPFLLDLLGDSEELKNDPYYHKLVSSCLQLIQEQGLIYATEADRELRFYLWINPHFSYFGLPHFCPHIRIPGQKSASHPQVANGVAWLSSGNDFALKENETLDPRDLQSAPVKCTVVRKLSGEEKRLNAKAYLEDRGATLQPLAGLVSTQANVLALSEAKKSASSNLIFAQAGFHVFSLFRELPHGSNNLPVLFVQIDGPCLRFGAAVRNAEAPFTVKVTELESFTLTKRILCVSQVEELALYFFKFLRVLRLTKEEMETLREQKCSIFPGIPGTGPYSSLCPRWQFKGLDEQLWQVEYISLVQPPSLTKTILKATISSHLGSRDVTVRIQEHYGSLFHQRLSSQNSPRLCPHLYGSMNYYERSDKLKYIVMERMGDKWKSLDHILRSARDHSPVLFRNVNKNLGCLKRWLQENPSVHHGDIRPSNILVNTSDTEDETPSEKSVTKRERKTFLGEIRLIDAEFGSEVETQTPRYPYLLNRNLFEEFGCHTREEFDRLPGSELTLAQDMKMLEYVMSRVVQTPNFNADDSSDSSGDSRRKKTQRKY